MVFYQNKNQASSSKCLKATQLENKLINPQLIQIKSNLSTIYKTFSIGQNKDTYKINPKKTHINGILS